MSQHDTHLSMLKAVANALGDQLRSEMAFVGGSTTGLLITDEFTREQVRGTDDVDLIVHVIGHRGFNLLQKQLAEHGFRVAVPIPGEESPICAMTLGELRVDFMPDDEAVLGFSNRWYRDAIVTAGLHDLGDGLQIRLVSPPYFIATKLEAWNGRGNGDALESRDIEDIINLVDGRPALLDEVAACSADMRQYIAEEVVKLLDDRNFEYAIQSHTGNSTERESIIFARFEKLAGVSD
jgi:predicted nucleotidyltransferase